MDCLTFKTAEHAAEVSRLCEQLTQHRWRVYPRGTVWKIEVVEKPEVLYDDDDQIEAAS